MQDQCELGFEVLKLPYGLGGGGGVLRVLGYREYKGGIRGARAALHIEAKVGAFQS